MRCTSAQCTLSAFDDDDDDDDVPFCIFYSIWHDLNVLCDLSSIY